MSLQVEKLEKNMAKLTIEVSAEDLEKAIQNAYKKQRNRISLPGFRKGKVPRQMIEKMYGAEIFYDDAANELIPKAYSEAYEESGLEIVSQPEIDVVQIEKGRPFIFTAEVATKPEVTLGEYKGLEVEKISNRVTQKEVDAKVQEEADKNARTIVVEGRPVQDKDEVILDFEGFVDGVAFEGGKGENYPLTIGSHSFIPGFEEALIGAELEKETDVNVTFPEDYQAEELAGKPAVFKCTVKRLQEKQLPDLDDDFVGEVSEESDTVEEYREEIKNKIAARKADEAKAKKEEAVVDAIIADAQMDIPDAMLDTQQRQMIQEYAQRLQYQGISFEQYLQFTGMTHEMLMDQVKPQALRRIQSRLVLEAVVAAENITATEEEIEEELKKMAEAYRVENDKVEEMLGKDGRKQIADDICVRKAADFVVENAAE